VDDGEPHPLVVEDPALSELTGELPALDDGVHTLHLTIHKTRTNSIHIHAIQLDRRFSDRVLAVRAHDTPPGVHQRWSTPRTTDHQMIVMECQSVGSEFCFAPINTPFGYFGPVFEDLEITRFNMSFWNSREIRPPTDKSRSHILGIGSAQGTFQAYGNENSTTKVTNWNPFKGTHGRVVIGLRYTHSYPYTTYYGYYWDEAEEEWELFSIGNKYSTKPRTAFKNIGGFMEMPSVRMKKRNGHHPRAVQYRGWVCDSSNTWHDLTRGIVQLQRNASGYTSRRFRVKGPHFVCRSGGFRYYRVRTTDKTLTKPVQTELPVYMQPRHIKGLKRHPPAPVIRTITVDGTRATVAYKTRATLPSHVTIFYGPTDPNTTIVDWKKRYEFDLEAQPRKNTTHQIELEVDVEDEHFRMLVQTSETQLFTVNTFHLQ